MSKGGLIAKMRGVMEHVAAGFARAVADARVRAEVRLAAGPNAYHDAARRGEDAAWRSRLSSADQTILDELDTMIARSRWMIANDPWAASSQGAFGRHVVGGGITARSAAKHPKEGFLLDGFNKLVDALWEERVWAPKLVDAEETKTLPEKQRLWMNELYAAGGVFVVEKYDPHPDAVRLLLQEVEYEQRDLTRTSGLNNRPVRGGIELGDRHQPLAYWLHTDSHPLDWTTVPPVSPGQGQRIPSDQCHHLYRQDRVRQRIGTPWSRATLIRLRNLAMYEQYTMAQARSRAAYSGFIEQVPDPTGGTNTPPDVVARSLGLNPTELQQASDTAAGEMRVNIGQGIWTILPAGKKAVMPTPGTPDSMYPPFVLEQLKGIAAGTGLDFPTVTRWYADGNFSSQRQAKLDLQAEIDWIQDILFIHRICQADRVRWLELCIDEGYVRAPGYWSKPAWKAAYRTTHWQGPPQQSIDRIKDEAAWDLAIKSGRASPQEYFNAYGKSGPQVLAELAEFRRQAAAAGVGDLIDQWLGTYVAQTPAAGMAPDNPAGVDPARGSGAGDNGGQVAFGGRLGRPTSLSDLVVRQHVLQSMLDDGFSPPPGNGNGNGNGRH